MFKHMGWTRTIHLFLLALVVWANAACSETWARKRACFALRNVPTAVIVEDPNERLFDPTLAYELAHTATYCLANEPDVEAQRLSNLIDPPRISDLRDRLGDQFDRTPIDQLGRLIGAHQVVHVTIQKVSLQNEPGVYRPNGEVAVRVIDVEYGRIIFPGNQLEHVGAKPGYTVAGVLPYVTQIDDAPSARRRLSQALAQRLGRNVARLFYDYLPRQAGEPFEH
jgi:hypothetical protein